MPKTEIQAIPVPGPTIELEAVPSQLDKAARFKVVQQPVARFRHEEAADETREFALYGEVGGKRFASHLADTQSRHSEPFMRQCAEVWNLGRAVLRKHFAPGAKNVSISVGRLGMSYNSGIKIGQAEFHDKIKELILKKYPNASDIAVDFSDLSIRFLREGTTVEVKREQLEQECKEVFEILTFLNTWQEAHESAMGIMGVRSWHTRLHTTSNRPVHGEEPFVVNNDRFKDYLPKNEGEFFGEGDVEHHHFAALRDKLPADLQAGAEGRVRTAGQFIRSFGEKLAEKIQQKQIALETLQGEQRAKLEKELEMWKKLKEKREGIDLLSTYTAAAFLGDEPKALTPKALSEKAQLTTNVLTEIFRETRGVSSEKWMLNPYKRLQQGSAPNEDDLKSYAIQAGDLFFHDDLAYLSRFDSTGARRMVRPSIEEFVIHNLMRPGADYHEDLRSFGLQTQPPEFQAELRELIQTVRKEANL